MSAPLEGSCLCGSVHVAIDRDGAVPGVCHCRHCQKQTGSAFSTIIVAPMAGIAVTGKLADYADVNDIGQPVTRSFCPSCGSPIILRSLACNAAGLAVVKSGLFDGAAPAPTFECFREDVLDWLPTISTGSRFPKNPPLKTTHLARKMGAQ